MAIARQRESWDHTAKITATIEAIVSSKPVNVRNHHPIRWREYWDAKSDE